MCVEQYAHRINSNSKATYDRLNRTGVIKELTDNYEDMHAMSTYSLNEYIDKRIQKEKL